MHLVGCKPKKRVDVSLVAGPVCLQFLLFTSLKAKVVPIFPIRYIYMAERRLCMYSSFTAVPSAICSAVRYDDRVLDLEVSNF